jgi:hypothetical protein
MPRTAKTAASRRLKNSDLPFHMGRLMPQAETDVKQKPHRDLFLDRGAAETSGVLLFSA